MSLTTIFGLLVAIGAAVTPLGGIAATTGHYITVVPTALLGINTADNKPKTLS